MILKPIVLGQKVINLVQPTGTAHFQGLGAMAKFSGPGIGKVQIKLPTYQTTNNLLTIGDIKQYTRVLAKVFSRDCDNAFVIVDRN